MFELTQDDYETISLLMDQVIPYLSWDIPINTEEILMTTGLFRNREPRDIPTTEARTSLRGIVPTLGQKQGLILMAKAQGIRTSFIISYY